MICRDRRIIFVHIPKTGGSSIEDMIWPLPRKEEDLWAGAIHGRNKYQTGGLQHLNIRQIREEVGSEIFESCYKFALVRDPVDRLVSQFNYLNKRKDLLRLLGLGTFRTFSKYLSRIQEVEHVQWTPQVDFLEDDSGTIIPELFPLETLSSQFETLARKTGLRADAPLHSNATLPRRVPFRWVTIRKDRIRRSDMNTIKKIYARDFERLGYKT